MYQPNTTYRIQFNRDFTFSHLEAIIPYLSKLGIKTIYASPVFEAVPGSAHGYDGINPNHINPEIGTLEQLRNISATLKDLGMGWLQDFVPNHMAFDTGNSWLVDFMEKGKMSAYDGFFDKNPHEQLMVPFLGSPLNEALNNKEIKLVYTGRKLRIRNADTEYPLNYTGYYEVLNHAALRHISFEKVLVTLEALSATADTHSCDHLWQQMLHELEVSVTGEALQHTFENSLALINDDIDFLAGLLAFQFYRLCHWRETNAVINYRRFFTVNGLICLQAQKPEVFEVYHRLLKQLVDEQIIQGIRIDHIDGLYDPAAYLDQLRALVGDEVYIVVEKILAEEETLPAAWPVAGTTGYDFLAQVNNVLIHPGAAGIFSSFYKELGGTAVVEASTISKVKEELLYHYFGGELDNLVNTFLALPQLSLPTATDPGALREAIAALLIYCPVYRFYPDTFPLSAESEGQLNSLLAIIAESGRVSAAILNLLRDNLVQNPEGATDDYRQQRLHFWKRCMQLTGPLMAKGVEDTLMYREFRMLALNEVGDDIRSFGMTADDFHRLMVARAVESKHTMNATATHDTKRGEDARARLQALSQYPELWTEQVHHWMELSGYKGPLSQTDRYFVIQSVYAALPFAGQYQEDVPQRLEAYLEKAVREAKQHSSWDEPQEAYEKELKDFAFRMSDVKGKAGKAIRLFLLQQEQTVIGNALAQLVLKCTCPGIADIYQGTEYWDLSFVDPDNRRPVDYKEREINLDKIISGDLSWNTLLRQKADGNIKLFVLHRLLTLRNRYPELFAKGLYLPLAITEAGNDLAFARRCGHHWVLVVVAQSASHQHAQLVKLPAEAPREWKNIFTDETYTKDDLDISKLCATLPVTVLVAIEEKHSRSAGILLPVFSLPSPYGMGDMGAGAYAFASFLSRSGQRSWQMLPMNPVFPGNAYSPYAAKSAFAGEPAYIDVEQLCAWGLLSKTDTAVTGTELFEKVDYAHAFASKYRLLDMAWQRFSAGHFPKLNQEYAAFCRKEKWWLNDYALYIVATEVSGQEQWTDWPEPLRRHDKTAIAMFAETHARAIAKQKWLQFVFYKQWYALKYYCEQLNIELIGDLPFYMDSHAADVWANQYLFAIDDNGKKEFVAGVPPDYFSETGQLWGMPVYNWEHMQHTGYDWWLKRISKNIELFHKVRLDHFRAFYDYWAIPATAETAKEGQWRRGPGTALFDLIRKTFPDMPFVAEDLGEIHEGVFAFRNQYGLPGMRILQFGFENYDAALRDLPHNFTNNSIAFTGTHDNNTTVGWYKELDAAAKVNINLYLGHTVTTENIAGEMIALAYKSTSDKVIIPLQDVLNLDEHARLNTPSTIEGNWTWMLKEGMLSEAAETLLLELVNRYNR